MSFDKQARNRKHNELRYGKGRHVQTGLFGSKVWRPAKKRKPKASTVKFLDFGRAKARLTMSHIRRIFDHRYDVSIPWGKGTRPLSRSVINQTLAAIRADRAKGNDILNALNGMVEPGVVYTEALGIESNTPKTSLRRSKRKKS